MIVQYATTKGYEAVADVRSEFPHQGDNLRTGRPVQVVYHGIEEWVEVPYDAPNECLCDRCLGGEDEED